MNHDTRGKALLIAGVVLLVVSLAADQIGVGGFPGFGWKQITGTVVGLGLTVAGVLGLTRKS